MAIKPWVEGPLELLNHGLEHIRKASAFDMRISMISIDNAIELGFKTYLGLPSRITKIKLNLLNMRQYVVLFLLYLMELKNMYQIK